MGRHAVQVAVEKKKSQEVEQITVLTRYPELLDETNWKCGCSEPHRFSEDDKKLFSLVHVKDWSDKTLATHFKDATAVISCLGNREPTMMGVNPDSWEAFDGNQAVISAMKEYSIERAVVMTSTGVNEDWPCMEYHWTGKIMSLMFMTCARKPYKDLATMEDAYRAASDQLDFLLVRPVGIGEDELPVNTWKLQREKCKDKEMGIGMAKLDVARFMMQEALNPTKHKEAVVIGPAVGEGGATKK